MLNPGKADVLNRYWNVAVCDLGSSQLECTVRYVDPWYELETRVRVRAHDYKVREAVATVVRTPLGRADAASWRLDALVGSLAYAGVGPKIREATAADSTGLVRGLVLENIKALRQARLFVWEREGINPADQLPLIERLIKDTCLFFSLPESIAAILRPTQLEEMRREDCLFVRNRYCLMRWEGMQERVTAGLSDSYHEMQVELGVEGDRVAHLDGRILRAPHLPCFEAEGTIERLRGFAPSQGPSAWEKPLLTKDGCTHLADVAREACASLGYWRQTRGAIQIGRASGDG